MVFFRFILVCGLLTIILLVAGAGVALFFGNREALRSGVLQSGSEAPRRFNDKKLGVSLTYPRAWESVYLGPQMIRFSEGRTTIILAIVELNETYTLEEYTKKNIQEISESAEYEGFTLVLEESSALTFGGREGRRISALMEKDEQVVRVMHVWTIRDKKAYSLSFSAPLGQYDDAVQHFENVLQSLHIRL